MIKKIKLTFCTFLYLGIASAQDLSPFKLTETWLSNISEVAPEKLKIPVNVKKNILIFSLHTGYEHWTIPHTEAVVKLIAEKSGAFNVITSKDISVFERENLKKYDAIVLNNNCSKPDQRNLFWDVLKEDLTIDNKKKDKKAKKLEDNLINYVKKGGGLIVLHGSIVMQNKSKKFGKMVGGSFDYHPKQQNIQVKLVDPKHPLVKGFNNEGFQHFDEPYFFKGAYFDYNFKPLLYMEVKELKEVKKTTQENIKYISWIKQYGKGRVFYSSPSHNPQSYKNEKLLQFLLNGMQYVVGDLMCDDSPIRIK